MRSSFLLAALAPFAAAAVLPRSAATIVTAIDNINANIAIVNTTLNTFKQGSLLGIGTVLKIQSQTVTLRQAVDNATIVANQSKKLTDNGSATVATSVLALQPNIESLVANLEAKKPAFDTVFFGIASASQQVRKDLIAQQNSSLYLGNAITAKLVGTYLTIAPIVVGQINDTFNDAINYFNNTAGKIPVPPFFPTA